MKYQFHLRMRPDPSLSVRGAIDALAKVLQELPADTWRISKPAPTLLKGEKAEFVASARLDRLFKQKVRCDVTIQQREQELEDRALFDDYLDIEFTPTRVAFRSLIDPVFRCCVEYEPVYRAFVGLADFLFLDRPVTIRKDWRNEVYRIHPVNFFDRELCKRAFKSTPSALVKKLKPHVEHIETVKGGLFVIASSEILDKNVCEELQARLRPLFG
jgi:hypothetical protein